MIKFQTFTLLPAIAALTFGCSKGGPDSEQPPSDSASMSDGAPTGDEAPTSEGPVEDVQPGDNLPTPVEPGSPSRPEITQEECKAQGGEIIGDIGDGAVYQEAYMCPSGTPPAGNIVSHGEGPQAVEGAVCCQ